MPTESEIDAAVLLLARASKDRLYVLRDGTFSAEGKGPTRFCVVVGIERCADAMIEVSRLSKVNGNGEAHAAQGVSA